MTGSDDVRTTGGAARFHPLHDITRAEARTTDGLLFTLRRDPDPFPFFLLYPFTSELPQASMPYSEDLGDGQGSGWTVRPAPDVSEVQASAGDILVAAIVWTTSLFTPPAPASAPASPAATSDLTALASIHVYGDHHPGQTAPLLYVLDNLQPNHTGGTPLWGLRLSGRPDPAATLLHLVNDQTGASTWQAQGMNGGTGDRLRAQDLLTAATAWAVSNGPAHTTHVTV